MPFQTSTLRKSIGRIFHLAQQQTENFYLVMRNILKHDSFRKEATNLHLQLRKKLVSTLVSFIYLTLQAPALPINIEQIFHLAQQQTDYLYLYIFLSN